MLNLMRKNVQSWFIKVVLFAIIIVFALWGVGSFQEKKASIAATVDDHIITFKDYQKYLYDLTRLYRERFGEDLVRILSLEKMAINDLISRVLLLEEAKRLKLRVTEDELRDSVSKNPAFQNEGKFDKQLYLRVLKSYFRQTPQEYEEDQKRAIEINKVTEIIRDSIKVSEKEEFDFYCFQKEKINLEFVRIKTGNFQEKTRISGEEIEKYFDSHKEEFRIPAKVNARYLSFSTAMYEKKVKVIPEDIEDYYHLNLEKFSEPEKIKASHILVKPQKEGDQGKEEALKKAKNILKEVREGKEPFSVLAKKYSDCPSAQKGGDLGYFEKGDMEKPFEDAAFSLKEGEISSLVETKFGFHIIKVEEIKEDRVDSLEEMKDQIICDLKKEKAQEFLDREIGAIYGQIIKDKDLEGYGGKNGQPVKSTGFFARSEAIPDIGIDNTFSSTAFSLEKGRISSPVKSKNKYYIMQLTGKEEARIPELNEVKEKVKKAAKKEKTEELAAEEAEKIFQRWKDGENIQTLAAKKGLKVEETGFFLRKSTNPPKIGISPALKTITPSLTPENPYPDEVVQVRETFFAIKLKEVKTEPFNSREDETIKTFFSQKQQAIFNSWIENLKKKADININGELVKF